MLRAAALVLVSSALALVVGCAEVPDSEETSGTDSAITGTVRVGKVVTVTGDALRLRRTPDKTNTSNVIGLLPVGTKVKVTDATARNGFYAVEVLTAEIKTKLGTGAGFVFGDFIEQAAQDPVDNTVEDGRGTGSWNVPERILVGFTFADCSTLKDDKGQAMGPSVEDFLDDDQPYAVIGLDTNTFSYGMVAEIEELSAKSPINPDGIRIPLRIVKTSSTPSRGGMTVTICASPATKSQLPTDGGKLNLTVYPDPL